MQYRTGIGFDVHPFAADRKMIIGGVEIEYSKGLAGHSDADVLLHAICDALLGAAALGDIGFHFPDSDPLYKNINSIRLLEKTFDLIKTAGYNIGNVDSMIALEKPKIASYIPEMKKRIAAALKTTEHNISVKATTAEKLGFIGREEGVAAFATVLIVKTPDV